MWCLLLAIFTSDIRLDRCLQDDLPDDAALSVALREAIPGGTVTLGPGVLILEGPALELRGQTGQPNRRLDVTIRGSGDDTIIRGAGRPHDVLNLNAVGGVTIRDVLIESASVTAGGSVGVNGISITNGSSDILIDGVTVRSVPFVYTGTRFDGGKAFTVQQGAGVDRSAAVFRNCCAVDCPTAFGLDADPAKGLPLRVIVDGCEARDCTAGVAVSFSAAKEWPAGFGVDVLGCRMIDVKRPLIVSRATDVRFQGNSISTVSAPGLPDPWEKLWPSSALVVCGGQRVAITGNTIIYRPSVALVNVSDATGPYQPSRDVVSDPNTVSR